MKLKNLLNALINPEKFAEAVLWRADNIVREINKREKKIKYGNENQDLTFFIIGFSSGWNGLAWIILHVLEHTEYAENKKYIPVIDLQNFRNQYLNKEDIRKENVWEYWFEQPTKYNFQTISKSKNIIKSGNTVFPKPEYQIGYFEYKNKERIKKLHDLYKKNIIINDKIQKQISQIYKKLTNDRKVLGIMCRGTDFLTLKPSGHPVQPNPEDIIDEAETVMKKYNCSHIFLSTEDKEIYDLFYKKFGNLVLSIPQDRISVNELNKKSLSELSDTENRKKTALSYLTSMYILSKCPCFISGITGGSILVKIMSNGFEYEHFWDIGLYPDKKWSLSKLWEDFCYELHGLFE